MDVASLLVRIGVKADTGGLEKLQGSLDSINGKLRLLAGAEVVKALFHLTENFGHSALELENTAAAAGMTTTAMQALQFAVAQTGGNVGELGMTMTHLARLIQNAKLGADEAVTTFYRLGISQQQVASFRTTEDALYGIMNALQKIKDPLKQHALMDQALGQGSRGLAAFALGGVKAAKESEAMAKRIGALVPPSALSSLARAKGSVDALGMMFKSVTATIAGSFAPVVVRVVEELEKFYSANREVIAQTFDEWTSNAAYALGFMVGLLETVGGAFIRFVGRHKDLIKTGLKAVVIFESMSVALDGIKTSIALAQGAWAVGVAVFSALPFIAMAAAIGLAVAALHDWYQLQQTGKVEDGWLYQAFTGTGKVGAGIQQMMQTASDFFPNMKPEVADHPMMRGLAGQSVVNNMSANIPPPMIAAPNPQPGAANVNLNVSSTNNITVPAGMSAADTKAAVATGVQDFQRKDLAQAMQRLRVPFLY